MSIFGGTNEAPLPGGGRNFKDGRYLVRLEAFKRGVSQQGKGDYVVAEVTVLEVLTEYDDSNKPGERVSWVQLARWQPFKGNVKAFIVAATGSELDGADLVAPNGERIKVQEALEKASAGDGTMLAGATMIASAHGTKTKAGGDFTVVRWESADE